MKKHVLKIGLTGGIGSGKSVVARIFETLGTPVYYADDRTKELMNADPLRSSIIQHFGEGAYTNDQLNRAYLAAIVFNDKEKLELLNSLTHPVTIKDASEWMQQQSTPYIIKEAALLFESGANKDLDYVIGVDAPQHIRVKRVMARDHVSEEDVMKRISGQLDEEKKMRLCDFVIRNNEEELVIPQVIRLHNKFLEG